MKEDNKKIKITNQIAQKVTDDIYKLFGTDSGIIFGIPPEHREAIWRIVKVALDADVKDWNDIKKRHLSNSTPTGVKTNNDLQKTKNR